MADARLKSFIDRVLRLKEEQDALASDIREVYAEAKGEGFDKTAMGQLVAYLRKREKDGDKLAEQSAIFDLYLSAYEGTGTDRATHTHARETRSYAEEKGRGDRPANQQDENGEITNEPEAAAEVAGDYLREPVAAEQGQIIREGDAPHETGRFGGDASCPDAELQMDRATEGSFETGSEAAEKGREAIPAGPEDADLSHAGAGGSPATHSHSAQTSSPVPDTAETASPLAVSATNFDGLVIPEFLRRTDGYPKRESVGMAE